MSRNRIRALSHLYVSQLHIVSARRNRRRSLQAEDIPHDEEKLSAPDLERFLWKSIDPTVKLASSSVAEARQIPFIWLFWEGGNSGRFAVEVQIDRRWIATNQSLSARLSPTGVRWSLCSNRALPRSQPVRLSFWPQRVMFWHVGRLTHGPPGELSTPSDPTNPVSATQRTPG